MMSLLSLKSHLGPAKTWDMQGYPAQLPVIAVIFRFVPFLRIFVAWDALLKVDTRHGS